MKHLLAFSFLSICTIVFCASSSSEVLNALGPAATPTSSAASEPNAKIAIKTEPLRNNKIDVEINGQRVASMEGNQVYSGVFAPGQMLITVPGGKTEFNAEADKEYLLEIALIPSNTGYLLFGLMGSSAMATYSITLKETRAILAAQPR
jgi:hypothetical protein